MASSLAIASYALLRGPLHSNLRWLLAVRLAHHRVDSTPTSPRSDQWPSFLFGTNEAALRVIAESMMVHEDFVSETEETSLLNELEPYMKRLRYETSHWDDAIHGYRETEKKNWNNENVAIIQRIRDLSFASDDKQLMHVHVLDIKKEGYIKAHVDSVRFCGDTIAGLSLLSSSIMRLVCEDDKEKSVDIHLRRRSLYIMRNEARYKYTHEILPDNLSYFKGVSVPRDRRISVICRNHPRVASSDN